MIFSGTYYALQTSSTANATTLVIGNEAAIPLVFTSENPNTAGVDNGNLILETSGANQEGPDLNTWVVINGATYSFTYDVVGTSDTSPNGNSWPVELRGKEIAVITTPVGNYFFVLDGTGTEALMNEVKNGQEELDPFDLTPGPVPVCFCAGTLIATPTGQRLIEELTAGDSVLTEDGRAVQIAWISTSRHSRGAATEPSRRPIVISANAFGPGLPMCDLAVSPQHRIVVEGPECELFFGSPRVFVIARHLPLSVAHSPEPDAEVVYYHLLLDQHYVLLANGLPCESFQPARRTVEALSPEARASLDATLAVLGEAAMLARPDALPTLASYEARVLAAVLDRNSCLAALPYAPVLLRHRIF
jgi:hypothetical protein